RALPPFVVRRFFADDRRCDVPRASALRPLPRFFALALLRLRACERPPGAFFTLRDRADCPARLDVASPPRLAPCCDSRPRLCACCDRPRRGLLRLSPCCARAPRA